MQDSETAQVIIKPIHCREVFMESYRLLHITWCDPPSLGLIIENNRCMKEWDSSIVQKKFMGTGMVY